MTDEVVHARRIPTDDQQAGLSQPPLVVGDHRELDRWRSGVGTWRWGRRRWSRTRNCCPCRVATRRAALEHVMTVRAHHTQAWLTELTRSEVDDLPRRENDRLAVGREG